MAKFIITTILLLGLASSVSMQSIPIQQGQVSDQLRQLPFGGSLLNLPSQIQGTLQRLPFMGGGGGGNQGSSSFLPNLQGNNGQGGFLSSLTSLPARSMQALGNLFTGFRNMLPGGLGRNSNGLSLPNMPSMPNLPSAPSMPSMPNMPNLSNLPMGDRLQQGASTLQNAVSSLTNGIRGVIPGGASVAPATS